MNAAQAAVNAALFGIPSRKPATSESGTAGYRFDGPGPAPPPPPPPRRSMPQTAFPNHAFAGGDVFLSQQQAGQASGAPPYKLYMRTQSLPHRQYGRSPSLGSRHLRGSPGSHVRSSFTGYGPDGGPLGEAFPRWQPGMPEFAAAPASAPGSAGFPYASGAGVGAAFPQPPAPQHHHLHATNGGNPNPSPSHILLLQQHQQQIQQQQLLRQQLLHARGAQQPQLLHPHQQQHQQHQQQRAAAAATAGGRMLGLSRSFQLERSSTCYYGGPAAAHTQQPGDLGVAPAAPGAAHSLLLQQHQQQLRLQLEQQQRFLSQRLQQLQGLREEPHEEAEEPAQPAQSAAAQRQHQQHQQQVNLLAAAMAATINQQGLGLEQVPPYALRNPSTAPAAGAAAAAAQEQLSTAVDSPRGGPSFSPVPYFPTAPADAPAPDFGGPGLRSSVSPLLTPALGMGLGLAPAVEPPAPERWAAPCGSGGGGCAAGSSNTGCTAPVEEADAAALRAAMPPHAPAALAAALGSTGGLSVEFARSLSAPAHRSAEERLPANLFSSFNPRVAAATLAQLFDEGEGEPVTAGSGAAGAAAPGCLGSDCGASPSVGLATWFDALNSRSRCSSMADRVYSPDLAGYGPTVRDSPLSARGAVAGPLAAPGGGAAGGAGPGLFAGTVAPQCAQAQLSEPCQQQRQQWRQGLQRSCAERFMGALPAAPGVGPLVSVACDAATLELDLDPLEDWDPETLERAMSILKITNQADE